MDTCRFIVTLLETALVRFKILFWSINKYLLIFKTFSRWYSDVKRS